MPEPPGSRRPRRRLAWVLGLGIPALAVGTLIGYPRALAHYHWVKAEAATRAEDFEAAQAHLALCRRARPKEPTYLFAAARLARRESDLSRAQTLLGQAAAAGHPADEIRLEELLITVQQLGWRGNDNTLLDRLPDAGSNRARIHEVLARAYFRDYLLDHALEQAEGWSREEPWSGLSRQLTGDILVRLRRDEAAGEAYREAVERNPELIRSRVGYAAALMKKRRLEEAEEQYRAALRIKTGDRDATLGLATVLLERGDVEALGVALELRGYFPRDPEAAGVAGRIALKAGQYDEATRLLQLSASHTAEPAVLQDLQRCLVRAGKSAEAKEVGERLQRVRDDLGKVQDLIKVASGSVDPAPRVEIGLIMIRNGYRREGVAWLREALRCAPDDKPAHAAMADYLESMGQADQAAQHRRLAQGP